MFPLTYGTIYQAPADYQPPEETELAADTEYPNLNSRDYARRPANRTLRMHSAWESITLNEDRHVAIATNKMSGRECTGSLWGFEQLDELTPETACYKLQSNALITRLQFATPNVLLLALSNGKLQVWSTHSEVRNPQNPYCLFLIGEKCEHTKAIICLDITTSNSNRAVTGGKDGTLKLWDLGSADLYSVQTFRFAHTDMITGVSATNKDDSIVATCSLDKSAMLWDVRLARPATALYENHNVRFRDVAWASVTESEHLLHLGDESGFVNTIDSRLPSKFVTSKCYHDRPIRQILPNGKYLGIIADSNVVKVASNVDEDAMYENSDSQHFVRSGVWRDAKELLTVGYDGKMRTHIVQ